MTIFIINTLFGYVVTYRIEASALFYTEFYPTVLEAFLYAKEHQKDGQTISIPSKEVEVNLLCALDAKYPQQINIS